MSARLKNWLPRLYEVAMRKPRFRFTLKMLLVVIGLLGIACAWLGSEIRAAEDRREVIEFLHKHGGKAFAACELSSAGKLMSFSETGQGKEQSLLVRLFDDRCYAPLRVVDISGKSFSRDPFWTPSPQLDAYQPGAAETQLRGLIRTRCVNEVQAIIAAYTDLDDVALAEFHHFRQLRYLDLTANQLTAAGVEQLRGHPTLEQLHVDQAALTRDAARELFASCPRLNEITLRSSTGRDIDQFWRRKDFL